MKTKYHYLYADPAGKPESRCLICPKCGEMLIPVDIEEFSSCPYCNTHLTFSGDLENFILSPVINGWIREIEHYANENNGFHLY